MKYLCSNSIKLKHPRVDLSLSLKFKLLPCSLSVLSVVGCEARKLLGGILAGVFPVLHTWSFSGEGEAVQGTTH